MHIMPRLSIAIMAATCLAAGCTGSVHTNPPSDADACADLATCPGVARLTWTAPTTNTDGTPLTDLGGYRVHHGPTARTSEAFAYDENTDVRLPDCQPSGGGTVCACTMSGLPSGTRYFAVTAYDTQVPANESAYSVEASKDIR